MQNPPPDPQQYPPNYAPGYAPPYSQPIPPTQPYSQPGYGQPSYGQPGASSPPNPPYASAALYPAYAPPRQTGDATTALVLEAVCAVFGLYGIGWMYRGRVGTGVVLLVLGFAWAAFMLIAIILTAGLAALCVGPLHLIFIVIDVLQFNNAQRRL